ATLGENPARPMMSRRRRKRAAATRMIQHEESRPAPAVPPARREEIVFGPDGLIERLVRSGSGSEKGGNLLAPPAARLCRQAPNPDLAASHFFASLGAVMGQDRRLGDDPRRFERCDAALRAAFYMAALGQQIETLRLTEDERVALARRMN